MDGVPPREHGLHLDTGGLPDGLPFLRRLARLQEASSNGEAPPDAEELPQGFARQADLWLIDGGQTHVAAAKEVLAQFGVDIPVFGMVKDSRHRTRAVTGDGGEIALSAHGELFAFITRIQDETHRYTISFSRKKHRQTSIQLELCKVPGIGETRARALYRAFKTADAIRQQDEAALAAVPGMNARAAKAVYDFYHPGT